jgi:glycine/D-amino acid oxidase-like deaminating enzyme
MSVTQKRDLRTGVPVWQPRSPVRLGLTKDIASRSFDVVIVGTGISGALVADALLTAGPSVLAIDRRKPMSGSTVASTALLQSELDTPLGELQKKIGKSDASRIWWRSQQAVQALKDRIADLRLNCDYRERTSLYLPGNVLDAAGLREEANIRQQAGLRSEFIDKVELVRRTGISKPGAILARGNAEVDPVKLTAAIWRTFLKRGGVMASNLEVTDVDSSRSKVRLTLADGTRLVTKHAVFCTGYELLKGIKPKDFKIISTWVLATKQQPSKLWPDRSLMWEAADPYLYLRTTRDGRIIVGGEDKPFSDSERRDAMNEAKVKTLARKAARYFPAADFAPDFSWTGSFGESPNGVPAIGPVKHLPNCYAVLGFGGNGITFSMLAAQIVSRKIFRFEDPDAGLFALEAA